MTKLRVLFVFFLLGVANFAVATDAYLVRFKTSGKSSNCTQASWFGDAYFFNQSSTPALVRFLGISNGELPAGSVLTFAVPPGKLVALSDVRVPAWFAAGQADPFFVLHLDIPADVVVESRDQVVLINTCIQNQVREPWVKLSLPIFQALVRANKVQTLVGTDAGSTPAHQNVAIYNAGAQQATAHIEVRRGCDNTVVDERTVTIPANTILQANGLSTGENLCSEPFVPVYARSTVVTVDQPSLVIVTTITDPQPDSGGLIPKIEMSIANSTQF